jgi:hypothetical protein
MRVSLTPAELIELDLLLPLTRERWQVARLDDQSARTAASRLNPTHRSVAVGEMAAAHGPDHTRLAAT